MERLTKKQPETHAPLPDLLTLEELREMDGEPVYLDFGDGGEWGLVRVQQGKVFITHKNTICAPANILFECGGKAYRRKPEISVQTVPLHDPPWKAHLRARFERLE